jgi:DNA-binding MarR family transcriptional regulator
MIETRNTNDDTKNTTSQSPLSSDAQKSWRFVTNHTQVLLCVAADPDVRLRDIAQSVGITERAAQRIVADLSDAGYLVRERVGRRNRYVVDRELKMRHDAQADHRIGELLDLLRLRDSV